MTSGQDQIAEAEFDEGYVVVRADSETSEAFENVGEDLDEQDEQDEQDELDEQDDTYDQPYYEKTIKEIAKGDRYPCMICTVEMDFTCHMYACPECYRVFDYECIREWAVKSTQKSVTKTWKCPNCYFEKKDVPLKNRPTCWCGKNIHPEPNPLNPNSCGQTCDAPICVHGCSSTCHLGPHPTCMRMVQTKCRCGKKSKDVFCSEARKHQELFRCGNPCGLILPCGVHKCQRECHNGICGECPETIAKEINCYCGLESLPSIKCQDVKIQSKSQDGSGKKWIGAFACSRIRTVEYSCREHSFAEPCKAPPSIAGRIPCPYSPKALKTCPCGETPLENMETPRTKCTDPIPTCDATCGKLLSCGRHRCPFKCHTGTCMEICTCSDKIKCSCNSRTFIVPCKFQGPPRCNTKCESLMSCRRHRCAERCCDGRSLAQVREKKVFLTRDKLDESLVEAQHICLKKCNLKLSCGRHFCQRKCHPGSCPPCLESDSNDLVCPCGKTVAPAPVRCGTVLPPCRNPCIKTLQGPLDCGHPPMPHACHSLDEPCPSCTAPVFKQCKCGKNKKVRTLCFQNNVSCGRVCGKQLVSCHHSCTKTCHREGECQSICKQVCGISRSNCSHICRFKCHTGSPCPDVPCNVTVEVKCGCGHRSSFATCAAHEGQDPADQRPLECTEDCAAARRRLELMEAFGMNTETVQPTEGIVDLAALAEKVTTFQELMLPFTEASLSIFAKQSNWCSQIEEHLNRLMSDISKPSLHFKPMKPPQRHFIHELAQAYKLYCESQDKEPKRSVYVKKTVDSHKPSLSLKEALPLYQSFKNAQKERKLKELERSTTTRILNYTSTGESSPPVAQINGLLIQKVFEGTDEKTIEACFADYLKHTLIKDPNYLKLDSGDVLVFAENYATASINVERDINRVVGHLDLIAKDSFLAEGVTVCRVEQVMAEETNRSDESSVAEAPEDPLFV